MSETDKIGERPVAKSDQKSKKNQETVLLVLLVAVVIGVIFILYRSGVIGGNASRKPVENYIQAICDCDFDGYVSTMPKRIAQDHIDDRDELGLSGSEYLKKLYADYFDEFGENMTAEIEFTGRSRPDAVYVDNFRESYKELYGEEIDFSAVFEIDATVRFSGGKSSDGIDLEFFVIKTGGNWCVVGADYKTVEAEDRGQM